MISALSGPALAWATPLVATDDSSLGNFPLFLTNFKQMFERPNLQSSAEEALCDILQGSQDVLTYITQFRYLAAKTTWVERTLVTLFRRGLKEEIKDELVHSSRITSLSILMDQALQIEHRLDERRRERRRGNPSTSVREVRVLTRVGE